MTPRRIIADAVAHSIESIAGVENRLVNEGIFAPRDVACRILPGRHGGPHRSGHQVRPKARRITLHDAVVVVRVALRFGKPLLATCRTAVPVREPRPVSVKCGDYRLGPNRHQMD